MYLFLGLSYTLIFNLSANPPDSFFEIFSESKCFSGHPFNIITMIPTSNFLHLDKYDSLLNAVSACILASLLSVFSAATTEWFKFCQVEWFLPKLPISPKWNSKYLPWLARISVIWPQLLHWIILLSFLLSPTLSHNSLLLILTTASHFPFRGSGMFFPRCWLDFFHAFFHLISLTLHLVFTLLKGHLWVFYKILFFIIFQLFFFLLLFSLQNSWPYDMIHGFHDLLKDFLLFISEM